MSRHLAQGPDSFPSVLGQRPQAKTDTTPPREEQTNGELKLPKLPPPKLAVFGPPTAGAPAEQRSSYRLGKVLGTGDLATVYEAHKDGADGFRKRVAVKRIHSHLAQDSRVIDLLGDEARLVSAIVHPNVCQVLDFVDDGAASFLVLEFLDGSTLMQAFQTLRLEPERLAWPRHQLIVARVIAGLAEGLHAAHELEDEEGGSLQVVHRDVTPHNLFVLKSGGVKVTDFGIARARSHVHETAAGVTKGRLGYMAPEQLHGLTVDRRTDIFALGVVMWELLTGERLFERPSEAQTVQAVLSGDVPDPSSRQQAIAQSISAVVLRALRADPRERFQDAREMSRALEQAIAKTGDSVPSSDVGDWIAALCGGTSRDRSTIKSLLSRDSSAAVQRAAVEPASAPLVTIVKPARGVRWPAIAPIVALALAAGSLIAFRNFKVATSAAPIATNAPAPTHIQAAAPAHAPVATAAAPSARPLPPVAVAKPEPPLRVEPPASTAPTAATAIKTSRPKSPSPAASEALAVSAEPLVRKGFVLVVVKGAAADILIEGRTYAANRPIALPVGPHHVTVVRQADHKGSREIQVNVQDSATSVIPVTVEEPPPAPAP